MDGPWRGQEKYKADMCDSGIGKRKDLWNQRNAHSHVELLRIDDLPFLNRVRSFCASGDGPRYFAPAPMSGLFRQFPRMETDTLELDDDERRYPDLRK